MGYMARGNPASVDCDLSVAEQNARLHTSLRAMLNAFPDRAQYERWLEARQVDEGKRAHLEQFLPAHLQAKGTV